MLSLERRLRALEHQRQQDGSPPCFWCQCEDRQEDPQCEHRRWTPAPHEEALTELT